jgi:hypothetical protein
VLILPWTFDMHSDPRAIPKLEFHRPKVQPSAITGCLFPKRVDPGR